jgi:hypothetical protein
MYRCYFSLTTAYRTVVIAWCSWHCIHSDCHGISRDSDIGFCTSSRWDRWYGFGHTTSLLIPQKHSWLTALLLAQHSRQLVVVTTIFQHRYARCFQLPLLFGYRFHVSYDDTHHCRSWGDLFVSTLVVPLCETQSTVVAPTVTDCFHPDSDATLGWLSLYRNFF